VLEEQLQAGRRRLSTQASSITWSSKTPRVVSITRCTEELFISLWFCRLEIFIFTSLLTHVNREMVWISLVRCLKEIERELSVETHSVERSCAMGCHHSRCNTPKSSTIASHVLAAQVFFLTCILLSSI